MRGSFHGHICRADDRNLHRSKSDEIVALARPKMIAVFRCYENLIGKYKDILLANRNLAKWNDYCNKILMDKLDNFIGAVNAESTLLSKEERRGSKPTFDSILSEAKQTQGSINAVHLDVRKKITDLTKRHLLGCSAHRKKPVLPNDDGDRRCDECDGVVKSVTSDFSARYRRVEIQLLVFIENALTKLPYIKNSLLYIERCSGQVEVTPFFDAIDDATATFAGAFSIDRKCVADPNEKPTPKRLRYCASSTCKKRETAPHTFQCCVQCRDDHMSPRNFYCSHECFLEDWDLIHRRCHEGRRREGFNAAATRHADEWLKKRDMGVEADEKVELTNEELVELAEDELDSEDEVLQIKTDEDTNEEWRVRRRNCSAYNCKESEKRHRHGKAKDCNNNNQISVRVTFQCCEQCRVDSIPPYAYYCSQSCFKKDWHQIHRHFHKIRRRKLRGDFDGKSDKLEPMGATKGEDEKEEFGPSYDEELSSFYDVE